MSAEELKVKLDDLRKALHAQLDILVAEYRAKIDAAFRTFLLITKEPTPKKEAKPSLLEDVRRVLLDNLQDPFASLRVEEQADGSVKVTPKTYLGADLFGACFSVLRGVEGAEVKYVSAGKNSHWLVTRR